MNITEFSRLARQPKAMRDAIAMQKIEGNPLSDEQIAMFENFIQQGLSAEQRLAKIDEWVKLKYGHVIQND